MREGVKQHNDFIFPEGIFEEKSPPPLDEDFFNISQIVEKYHMCRPISTLELKGLYPYWICGAHQKK